MINIAFDMETQDPDDVLTLCLLATHPAVRLRAVTVNPGSKHQIGVVKHVLNRIFGLKKRSDGKFLHDLLAACALIDFSFITWAEVEMYREKGEWGAKLLPSSDTKISVSVNRDRFEQLLIAT